LIESELFGHVKGVYFGCKDRAGKFEAADKGLFS
jgi:transcriptional regulator with GAF, ATPase, and Fis domain